MIDTWRENSAVTRGPMSVLQDSGSSTRPHAEISDYVFSGSCDYVIRLFCVC